MVDTRGRQRGLSRDEVLREALRIVDDEGADALTFRSLSLALRVDPVRVYHHVEDKAELAAELVDLVASEITPPPAAPWRERLEHIASELRRVCLAHPGVLALARTAGHTMPATLRPMDAALAALDEAGLDAEEAASAWCGLIALVLGHVAYQRAGHLASTKAARALPRDAPHVRALASAASPEAYAAFAWALGRYLDGLTVPALADGA